MNINKNKKDFEGGLFQGTTPAFDCFWVVHRLFSDGVSVTEVI
jgi:hypothetical protein